MSRGAWWATIHGVTDSQTQLSMHAHCPHKIRSGQWNVTALGSLSTNVQGCVPVFLKDWPGAAGTGACCLLGGAWS